MQAQFSYSVLFPFTLWYFPLNCLKIINMLSKSKREFSFVCGGEEEEAECVCEAAAEWRRIVL